MTAKNWKTPSTHIVIHGFCQILHFPLGWNVYHMHDFSADSSKCGCTLHKIQTLAESSMFQTTAIC